MKYRIFNSSNFDEARVLNDIALENAEMLVRHLKEKKKWLERRELIARERAINSWRSK